MSKKEPSNILSTGLFGDKITLVYDEPIQHHCVYLPAGHLSFNIMGCSGSGKSHVLLSLIPQIANLSQIIICSLVPNNPVYEAIDQYCRTQEPPLEFQVFTDPMIAREGIEAMIKNKPEGSNGFCIMDDFSIQNSGYSDPYNRFATMISALLRNEGYHYCFITQSATGIMTKIRNNSNIRIVFQMNDSYAIQSIRRDFINTGIIKNKHEFDELYGLIQKVEHSFLMMVNKGGKNNKLYIYLPGQGADEPQEVVIDRIPDLEIDPKMVELTRAYKVCRDEGIEGKGTDYTQIQKKRIKNMLKGYINYLAQQFDADADSITDIVARLHKVDL